MMNAPHTWFISDIHLDQQAPAITDRFIKFIKNQTNKADSLYILGDLFEAWIGDDELMAYQDIVTALKNLSQRMPIYIMRGNRDFLIGKRLATACGATLLPDPTVITLYGKRILLTHGDKLCTDDHAYQRFQRIASKRWLQRLFLCLPLAIRTKMAQKIRRRSQRYTQDQTVHIMDVTEAGVTEILSQHQPIDYLIHGHTHRPAIHTPLPSHPQTPRIVLGSWHHEIQALHWGPNDHTLQGDDQLG